MILRSPGCSSVPFSFTFLYHWPVVFAFTTFLATKTDHLSLHSRYSCNCQLGLSVHFQMSSQINRFHSRFPDFPHRNICDNSLQLFSSIYIIFLTFWLEMVDVRVFVDTLVCACPAFDRSRGVFW